MRKSYMYAVITVLFWSTLATAAKLVLNDIPNFQMLTLSSAAAFLFLLVFNLFNGSLRELKTYCARDFLLMTGLGVVGIFFYSVFYYYGITQLGSQEACILNYLWPLMIVIFACLILGEKFTVRKIIAMILSFAGIVVLTLGNSESGAGNRALGIAACVAAAVCYGLFSVLNKKHSLNQKITMMWFWMVTAVCSFFCGLFFEKAVPVGRAQWLGLLWLGIAVNAIAYLLWALAIKGAEDSAKVANLAYLVPLLSVIVSAIILKEKITVNAVFALVLILGGILLQNVRNTREREMENGELKIEN